MDLIILMKTLQFYMLIIIIFNLLKDKFNLSIHPEVNIIS